MEPRIISGKLISRSLSRRVYVLPGFGQFYASSQGSREIIERVRIYMELLKIKIWREKDEWNCSAQLCFAALSKRLISDACQMLIFGPVRGQANLHATQAIRFQLFNSIITVPIHTCPSFYFLPAPVNPCGGNDQLVLQKMAERSEAKSAKRSFASKKFLQFDAKLRFAQPFLAKLKWTIIWPFSSQGLIF